MSTRRRFLLQFDLIVVNSGTDEIFRARALILSPSKKSIARLALRSRSALKSLSGSGRLAPWAKGKLHLLFVGVGDRDHSVVRPHRASHPLPFLDYSRSASRMLLRMLANVLPRQSVSSVISWSIRSDGSLAYFPLIAVPFAVMHSVFSAHSNALNAQWPLPPSENAILSRRG